MYRLLATDIDDTILAPDGSLPESNRRALTDLHHRGIAVVFSSGRATCSLRAVAQRIIDLADDEYLISYNGARVTSALSGHPLVETPLDRDTLADILEYTRANKLLVHGYHEDAFLAEHSAPDHDRASETYATDTGMEWSVTPNIVSALPQGSPKLLIIHEHQALLRHREKLLEISAGRFDVMFSKPHYLEVVAHGVSKGAALTRLSQHLGIPIEETVAVGDSLNDREMILTAGVGLAVANAREELKDIADQVLRRSAADGAIAELAERYFSE